jgi:hypothetical protein
VFNIWNPTNCAGEGSRPARIASHKNGVVEIGPRRKNVADNLCKNGLSVQCREQCTKKNKIELAEESNIWRISIERRPPACSLHGPLSGGRQVAQGAALA